MPPRRSSEEKGTLYRCPVCRNTVEVFIAVGAVWCANKKHVRRKGVTMVPVKEEEPA